MKLKQILDSAIIYALSFSFILIHSPTVVLARTFPVDRLGIEPGAGFKQSPNTFPTDPKDLDPEDQNNSDNPPNSGSPDNPIEEDDDTGLPDFPNFPPRPGGRPGNNNNNNNNKNNNNNGKRPNTKVSMLPARVPEPYNCPLFENRPHAELISAVDSILKEVKTPPECNGARSAEDIQKNAETLRTSIIALQGITDITDPAAANNQIKQNVNAALTAVSGLSEIFNNNNFLNSECGTKTMASGKLLLGLNDIINGVSPYALMALSMNPAMAPAAPYIVGGVVASSAVSTMARMYDENTLKMSISEHRKAVMQNTCQFTKIAKKVRYMELAQSGQIDQISNDLEKNINFYKVKFSKTSESLSKLLKFRADQYNKIKAIEDQLKSDSILIGDIEAEFSANSNELFVCSLSAEILSRSTRDGKSFPASVFTNLDVAMADASASQKLKADSFKAVNKSYSQDINNKSRRNDRNAVIDCAKNSKGWLINLRGALNLTSRFIYSQKDDLEAKLSQNPAYKQWSAQYNRLKTESDTIDRVEKAMKELAKDNSVIDRTELSQKMKELKAGLFGRNTDSWFNGEPPVLAWINHTKGIYDQFMTDFEKGLKNIQDGAFSLTSTGIRKSISLLRAAQQDPKITYYNYNIAKKLLTLTPKTVRVGSDNHEDVCKQLEWTWLNWSRAITHLGAIQFFCDMIDPVLDDQINQSISVACKGQKEFNGNILKRSIVDNERNRLVSRYQEDAKLIDSKLKALKCPKPPVSDMNDDKSTIDDLE